MVAKLGASETPAATLVARWPARNQTGNSLAQVRWGRDRAERQQIWIRKAKVWRQRYEFIPVEYGVGSMDHGGRNDPIGLIIVVDLPVDMWARMGLRVMLRRGPMG